MTLVVDASVAVKWYLEEPDADAEQQLAAAESDLIAPDLITAEVGNVLWTRLRTGEITREQAQAIAIALPRAFAVLTPSAELLASALAIATALDHPIYDCLYLALADRSDASLVTADRRLFGRIQSTTWTHRLRLLAG